jgi:hypothetical protein
MIKPVVLRGGDFACAREIRTPDEKRLAMKMFDIRQNIPQGGESRAIDLRGIGKRSVRRIDFWYDTKGFLKGKADVTVFGMK